MNKEVDIEDFDVWQDEHHRMTADKETYQMVRAIAVDFSNAMFSNSRSANTDMLAALHAVSEHFNLSSESAEEWQELVWQAITKAEGQ